MESDTRPDTPRSAPDRAVEVAVLDHQSHLRVDADDLAGLARRVLEAEGIERASVSIVLVDDATIHDLNRRHLGHDWTTDVITFDLSEDDEGLAAELVVSAEMAAATARRSGADPEAELALYVVHGLLHLCGYDDREPAAAEGMRRREEEVLSREGIVNTFPMVGPSGPGPRGRGDAP